MTEQDAVAAMLQKGGAKPTATEYMLQQVIFVVPAERARLPCSASASARPRPCARASTAATTTREFAKGLIDVTVRDLGRVLAPELPPEWADSIKNAKPGGATSVRETERGIEFIGICSSREVSDDRVAQMVFSERGQATTRRATSSSKKYIAELREKARIVER